MFSWSGLNTLLEMQSSWVSRPCEALISFEKTFIFVSIPLLLVLLISVLLFLCHVGVLPRIPLVDRHSWEGACLGYSAGSDGKIRPSTGCTDGSGLHSQ